MTGGGGWMSPTQSHCKHTECTHGGVLGSEPPWRRLVTYSGVSALLVTFFTSLHPQITCRHCSKFSVTLMSIWTSQNSSTVSSLVVFDSHCRHVGKLSGSYSSTVSVGWIRLYHVCAFTYLSLSIIFTADTSSSSRPCCSVECSCKSHMWARRYTGIHGAFQGVHRSREPGCNKYGVNHT